MHKNTIENQQKIKRFIQEHFPRNYAIRVRFIDTLPLTMNRKIDINQLKKLCDDTDVVVKQASEVELILTEILKNSFDALTISDLDSLDLVRFFLDVEKSFQISIPDNSIVDLKNMSNLVDFIMRRNTGIILSDNCHYSQDLTNLKNIFRMSTKLSGVLKDTLYIQKNYFEKDYHSVLFFDISLDGKMANKLERFVEIFFERFDITKLLIYRHDGNVHFKYVKDLIPIIFYSASIFKEEDITDLMFNNNPSPLFFCECF